MLDSILQCFVRWPAVTLPAKRWQQSSQYRPNCGAGALKLKQPTGVSFFLPWMSNSSSFQQTLCCFFYLPAGQRSPSGGVSHQKEAGLSFEGVSDWRQGRHGQLQHQSSAPSHEPRPSQEPTTGTEPKQYVERILGRVMLVYR